KGNIITGLNSGINDIEDLMDCNMAFVNQRSTMGYIVPIYYIYKNTSKKKNINSYKFLNNHNDVCLGILSGDFDAGAVKYETFLKYKNKGLRSIVAFDSIPGITIVARKGLDKKLIKAIRKALINIKSDKDSEKILKSLNPLLTGFVPAKDSDFDKLREINRFLEKKSIIH
ncbi:MAG: PhnD/SsuA/transferrin family substrate-binding protein, partial [Candidatus Delongbacteria bacterium]|nr:PhnD/SsuA/transferrin family substrate-binding protein [Candidatus Delongbacteria bacterium]